MLGRTNGVSITTDRKWVRVTPSTTRAELFLVPIMKKDLGLAHFLFCLHILPTI